MFYRKPPRATPLSSDAILERVSRLHPKLIDLGLDRVEALLGRLNDPHKKLPPVIHVAGTNAKGSVIAFLRAILEAAGLRVHVYTSPHLVRFNERIRLAGSLIEDQALADILEECEAANGADPITFFEITTAAAFLAFSRHPADVVLLETGLGGRLDATSAVEKPALCVLTPISMDHQKFLGDTLDEITLEKTAIMKPGVACVTAAHGRKTNKLVAEQAKEIGAPLFAEGKDWFVRKAAKGLIFESGETRLDLPFPALVGAHQHRNAGLAVATVKQLTGFAIPKAALSLGLKTVQWPGRLQILTRGPLPESLADGWELWLDGGHNPAAAEAIAKHYRSWRKRPLYLILGMMEGKDPQAFLKPLEGKIALLRTIKIPGKGSLDAATLAEAGRTWRMEAAPCDDVSQAVTDIATASEPGRILICGSLYLAGSVLKDNG